jgi:DNA-binding response OmpR family regulator
VKKGQVSILIVDDEEKILEVIESLFLSVGYNVFKALNGKDAQSIFEKENMDLLILDLMLPDISGIEICKEIRKKSRLPIIMLTAKAEEADVIKGFNIGADDYLVKPFSLAELNVRVMALLRRTEKEIKPLFLKNSYNDGDLVIDFEKDIILKNMIEVKLTPKERNILYLLIKYPGKIFTRDELIEIAMGDEFSGYDRAVDSHIKNLRQKIETDPKHPQYVITIHGIGYRFGGV